MKFKKGDKVRFLNDVGGGTVVRIIDQRMVEVLNDDDFEVPVLTSELVKIDAMESTVFSNEQEEKNLLQAYSTFVEITETVEEEIVKEEPVEETLYIEGNDQLNVFMAIVPEDGGSYIIHIINDSNYQSYAMISEKEFDQVSNIWNGRIGSNRKQIIKTYTEKQLAAFPTMDIQMLFFKFGKHQSVSPLHKEIAIHPQKFYRKGSFVENDYFNEDAIIIPLKDEDINQNIAEMSSEAIAKIKSEKSENDAMANALSQKFRVKKEKSPIKEVDLHIHELIDNHQGLSHAEMLHIQMETFHKALNEGIKNHDTKKMVFIHGVGAGTLKNELRKALSNDYPQLYFQDASFKEYGFGATLVIIRRG